MPEVILHENNKTSFFQTCCILFLMYEYAIFLSLTICAKPCLQLSQLGTDTSPPCSETVIICPSHEFLGLCVLAPCIKTQKQIRRLAIYQVNSIANFWWKVYSTIQKTSSCRI